MILETQTISSDNDLRSLDVSEVAAISAGVIDGGCIQDPIRDALDKILNGN